MFPFFNWEADLNSSTYENNSNMDEQTIDFMSKVLKYNDSQVSTQLFYYLLFQLTNTKHKNKPKIKEDGVLKALKIHHLIWSFDERYNID